MKLENVVPDIYEMMARKILEKVTVEEIREYFGDNLEPNMSDEDVRKFFAEWLKNKGMMEIPKLYRRYVEEPREEELSIIRTRVIELPELNLSAVVESRTTYIGGMEDSEEEVVSIEIDGQEYEVDSDVEDAILSLL